MFQYKFSFLKRMTGLRMRPALLAFGAAAVLGGSAVNVEAAQFGLFNTGIDPGVMMGVDAHYKVALEGATTPISPLTYVTDPTGLPYTPPDNSTSRFISPQPTYAAGQIDAGGYYNFTTTFDLTGVNLGLASIQGRFESDDAIVDVLINGKSLGILLPDPDYKSFSSYYNLAPNSSYLLQSTNTLTFRLFNYTGASVDPVSLRAEFLTSVPEPSVWASVVGLALVAVVGTWLRRRRATV